MRAWRQEAALVALCFAAATAIPFLPPEAQARFGTAAGGAPPLLLVAVATVLGTGAVWSLRTEGFFGEGPAGGGLGTAVRIGAAFALPLVVADLAHPWPADINQSWPAAWLYYPALAVVTAALLQAVPLALAHLALRRAWPAMILAAAVAPGLQALWPSGQPGWQRALAAAVLFGLGLTALSLFRRHGIAALIAAQLAHAVVWRVLWGAARLVLPLAPA